MHSAGPRAILCLALSLGVAATWAGPAQDIIATRAGVPLMGEEVPGLLEGGEIMDRLGVIRDELVSGVPEVALESIKAVIQRIDRLQSNEGPGGLPDSYRAEGDLWLPVKAVRETIVLDAPNLVPRPRDKDEGGTVGNLQTRGVRIDWLPLMRTRSLLDEAVRDLAASGGEGGPPLARVEEALGGLEQTVRFEQSALLDAYYAVQRALAAQRPWPQDVRIELRGAAQALYKAVGPGDLPDQVQAVADELEPDNETLLDTARSLRERIEAGQSEAGGSSGATAPVLTRQPGPVRETGRPARDRGLDAQGQATRRKLQAP
jgi:hypothetical protein